MTEVPQAAAPVFATASRPPRTPVPWAVVAVVSAGGVLGALARYALGVAYPHRPAGFPWATFGVNVSGCFLIGVLVVLVADVWPGRRLLRPFLGTGVLGGYTTFSTAMVDVVHLGAAGAWPTAVLYLAGTLLAALAAVHAGLGVTRSVLGRARGRKGHR